MYFRALKEVVDEQKGWATGANPRIPIGYQIMDARTEGGAASGEVILFTARSQVGKTTFALNVVNNNPEIRTVFFSLEMHGRYIASRLAAVHSNVPTKDIERSLRDHGDHIALERMIENFDHLAVIDKPAMSLKEMGVALNEVSEVWGEKPQLVIVDFLELIGGVPTLSAVEQVDRVTRKVKDFARDNDVVLMILHQVGQGAGAEGHKPLSIISGKYGGETSADYVLGAYRPCLRPGIALDEYQREVNQFFLQFLKTRGGGEIHPAGLLHRLNPETLRISTWDINKHGPEAAFEEYERPSLVAA